jgi:hypothetical protein
MAITENVNIVFTSDTKGIEDTTDELVKTGKATEQVVDKFKKINTETKKVADGFVPLRQRLREAKEELQRAEDQFGAFSAEANAARKNAGALADELADLNRQVGFLNPEDKIKAFSNLGQGIVGSFQVATGALQAFGAENERVQEIAQKLQGALNVVQGIQSIKGLKEAYQDVKIVLGLTTAAQGALTTATTAGSVATAGAATATRSFTAALASNPVGLVAVAVASLAGAYILLKNSTEESTEATKEEIEAQEELIRKYQEASDAREGRITDTRTEIALLKGEITPLQAKILEIEQRRAKALAEAGGSIVDIARINKEFNLLIQLEELRSKKAEDNSKKQKKTQEETKKSNEEEIKLIEERGLADDKVTADIIENRRFIAQTSTELFQEEIAAQERRQEIAIGLAQASFDFIQDLSKASRQAQINDIEEQKEQGLISEEEYQAKLRKIKNDAAKQEKEFAVFAATLAFTEALVKALTTPNPPAALALAAAVGGLNLAKIIATPVPRFKQGTLNVGGGNLDADGGSLAMLHPGEAVIPADRNRSYHPTLKAIYEKQISPSDINAYVLNRLAGRGSIGRDTVTAKVDTYALSKAMSRNKGVQIENAQIVGKAIASELAGRINRRQML